MVIVSMARTTASPRGAFSLVEVVLALGIIGAAFIPLLGLLSVGFLTMKESNLDVKSALIAQKFLAGAQLVPYAELGDTTHYLDYDGNEVPETDSAYTVQLVSSPDNLLGSASLKKVTLTLTGPAVEHRPRVYSSTVANLGD